MRTHDQVISHADLVDRDLFYALTILSVRDGRRTFQQRSKFCTRASFRKIFERLTACEHQADDERRPVLPYHYRGDDGGHREDVDAEAAPAQGLNHVFELQGRDSERDSGHEPFSYVLVS